MIIVISGTCAAMMVLVIIVSCIFAIKIDWEKDGGFAGYAAFGVEIARGGIEMGFNEAGLPLPVKWKLRSVSFPRSPRYPGLSGQYRSVHSAFGFDMATSPYIGTPFWQTIIFPLWLPLALFAIAPALALRTTRRRRLRLRGNYCLNCGYDLRATPTRCPECGTAGGQP